MMHLADQRALSAKDSRVSIRQRTGILVGVVWLFSYLLGLNACLFRHDTGGREPGFTPVKGLGMDDVRSIPFDSLVMIDPYILADMATHTYYMTGTGGTLWKSPDLQLWEGPFSFIEIDTTSWMGRDPLVWAPELHVYKGKYYCITTFTNTHIIVDTVPERCDVLRRGTHILAADRVTGPYRPVTETPYLPDEWSTLDGTLYEEEGVPHLIFIHDWMQLENGQVKQIALAEDLSHSQGEAISLFSGNDATWNREMQSIGELTLGMSLSGYVTDGPFLFRTGTGRLGMLWSGWSDNRYAQGVAYSRSGRLKGPWDQQEQPLVTENAGHGMLFTTFEGTVLLSLHYQPLGENPGPRRPMLLEVDITGDVLKIKGRYNP